MKRVLFAALCSSLLLFATATLVRAWPDQPPTKVTISGPGIYGDIFLKVLVAKLASSAGGSAQLSSGKSTELSNSAVTSLPWQAVVEGALAITTGVLAVLFFRRRVGPR